MEVYLIDHIIKSPPTYNSLTDELTILYQATSHLVTILLLLLTKCKHILSKVTRSVCVSTRYRIESFLCNKSSHNFE